MNKYYQKNQIAKRRAKGEERDKGDASKFENN
jgi:hypothetical protein